MLYEFERAGVLQGTVWFSEKILSRKAVASVSIKNLQQVMLISLMPQVVVSLMRLMGVLKQVWDSLQCGTWVVNAYCNKLLNQLGFSSKQSA